MTLYSACLTGGTTLLRLSILIAIIFIGPDEWFAPDNWSPTEGTASGPIFHFHIKSFSCFLALSINCSPLTAPSRSSQCLVVKIQNAMCVYDNLGITILRDSNPASPRHSKLCIVDAFSATEITFAPLRYPTFIS